MNNRGIGLSAVLLLSYTYTMMATTFIMPIMGNLSQAFPNAGTKISMLISLPALIMIPAILLAGYLSKYISKKTILIIGSVLYIIGGLGGGLYDNIDFILFMRAIGGLGTGLVFPLVPALIAQLYHGQQVPQMIGWGNSTGAVSATIFATITGYLAVLDWHNAFYLYALYILLLIGQIIILPKVPPEKQDAAMLETKEEAKLNWLSYVYVLATFIYMVVAMVIIVRLSVFIMEEGIGNSVQAGMSSSISGFTSLLTTLVFGQIYINLKRYTFVAGMACVALCFFILGISHDFTYVAISQVFMGVSLGTVLPYLMTVTTKILPKGARTTGISFISTSMYIGQFVAAYYASMVEGFGGGSIRGGFTISSIILLVVVIVSIVFIIGTKKQFTGFYVEDDTAAAK